ncbi:MAG: L,D-transpeptidase [Fusobacteriaceae bacterium]
MKWSLRLIAMLAISILSFSITINQDLKYNKYTLPLQYSYGKEKRTIQIEKMKTNLEMLIQFENESLARMETLGLLRNYKNANGQPAPVVDMVVDKYGIESDSLGNKRYQGIPLYKAVEDTQPIRYALDGNLVAITNIGLDRYKVRLIETKEEYYVPKNYTRPIKIKSFNKAIFVDRKNQNIVTLEKTPDSWLIRSINPASTGLQKPPYYFKTPLGVYVMQSKLDKMDYLKEGSKTEIEGFAPYASRFTGGVYIHGVPVNLPKTEIIEYSPTLGTYPVSHKCIRTPSSHAKFIYQWSLIFETAIFVIE